MVRALRSTRAARRGASVPRLGTRPSVPSRPGLREHVLLLLVFFGTRAALYAAGLRFFLDLRWMFLSDLVDLRERLLETVYYFHAFAPGMNLITGALLKLGEPHVATLATGLFWIFGWLLAASLFETLKALGFSRRGALAISTVFSLLPQTLYLEHLFLYTYLCASLLCIIGVLFWRALRRPSLLLWSGFFFLAAGLGWLYTAFHLLWFVALFAIALVAARGNRRRVMLAAALPALLLVSLYVKNYAVFGVFGATSWGPANLTLATTQQMGSSERNAWIRAGKLSPYAAVNVYSPPSAYLRFFPSDVRFPWPGSNELVRPSVNVGNFNHGLFLEVNRRRGEDAKYYLRARPFDYLRRIVSQNLPALFHSTTHWHPHDRYPSSPHHGHRAVLGGYERMHDRLVHTWPVPGVGLYTFLPLFYAWGIGRAFTWLRAKDRESRLKGGLLGLCLFQISYVVTVSTMATFWEASRYRYAAEPFIWVLVALALHTTYHRIRGFWPGSRRIAASGASGQIA